jgi:hypothetical protein
MLFRTGDRSSSKTLEYVQTDPSDDVVKLSRFAGALDDEGVICEEHQDVLAKGFMASLAGVKAEKGSSQAAVPVTQALALLQNMRGLQGARNPPDVGLILERLFAFGSLGVPDSATVAARWDKAIHHRLRLDPLAAALDRAVGKGIHIEPPQQVAAQGDVLPDWWQGQGALSGTPFSWFHTSWLRLTNEAWVEALPARVWVDWASTVLRLAVGFGYLWESAWYETFARSVLKEEGPNTFENVRNSVPATLPWKSTGADMSVRDLASPIGWRVRRSNLVRAHIHEWLDDKEAADDGFSDVAHAMSRDSEFCQKLEDALGSRQRRNENLWEAVKYALKTRDAAGPFADHYGLLKARGRYLWVEPGTEWTAVVASLCCPEPDSKTDLRSVLSSLNQLGLYPELADLVSLLEEAGMARGSADADQGVVVQSAF